jgi:hypothetical protein
VFISGFSPKALFRRLGDPLAQAVFAVWLPAHLGNFYSIPREVTFALDS